MKKEQTAPSTEDVKTDLRHDTMQFGEEIISDEISDPDGAFLEGDVISIDELDALEDDDIEDQAAGLSAVEKDVAEDPDTLPEEDWTDDLPDGDPDEDNDDEEVRPAG